MSFAQVKVTNYKDILHPPFADLAEKRNKMILKKNKVGNNRRISFSPKQKLNAIITPRKQVDLIINSVYLVAAIIFLLSLI